jgi:hypothetical protein
MGVGCVHGGPPGRGKAGPRGAGGTPGHRALRGLLGQLREVKDPAGLAAVLDELPGKLKAHIAHEEFPGGLYESMGALEPAYANDVRELVHQHFMFLSTVRSLADEVRRAEPPVAPRLLEQAAGLAEQLHSHEAIEQQLAERILAGRAPTA